MYYIYLDTMQVPIPPSSLKTKIKNRNKTIDLLEKGEVNVIKSAGLTEISFRMMLPNSKYPFSQQIVKGMVASILGVGSGMAPDIIDTLESLKTAGQPFQFIVVRMKDSGSFINMMNVKVTLEEYSIEDNAAEGYDMYADITLKKYVDWGAKTLSVSTDSAGNNTGTVDPVRSIVGHSIPTKAFAIKAGETLMQGMKRTLGNPNNLFKIAALNKIAVPAVLAAGQVVKINTKVEDVLKIPGVVMH